MNDSTQITYEEVRADANIIQDKCNQMKSMFDEFTSIIKVVLSEDAFIGSAQQALEQKYNKLKPKFDEYVNLVNDFVSVINTSADIEEATEKELASDTEGIME